MWTPPGPGGQPLPGVRPAPMDLQLQREAEITSSPAVRGGAPGLSVLLACTHVHTLTLIHTRLIKVTWFGDHLTWRLHKLREAPSLGIILVYFPSEGPRLP